MNLIQNRTTSRLQRALAGACANSLLFEERGKRNFRKGASCPVPRSKESSDVVPSRREMTGDFCHLAQPPREHDGIPPANGGHTGHARGGSCANPAHTHLHSTTAHCEVQTWESAVFSQNFSSSIGKNSQQWYLRPSGPRVERNWPNIC